MNNIVVHYGKDEKRDFSLKKIKMTKKAIFNYTTQKEYSIFNILEEEKNKSTISNNSNDIKLNEKDYMKYYKNLLSKENN